MKYKELTLHPLTLTEASMEDKSMLYSLNSSTVNHFKLLKNLIVKVLTESPNQSRLSKY